MHLMPSSEDVRPRSATVDIPQDTKRRTLLTREPSAPEAHHVFLLLLGLRLLNALTIRTFFQPDEYFQSLEPGWQIAFGQGSGAWITWEWRKHLRSSIHPSLFAAVYYVTSLFIRACNLTPARQAEVLIAAPKIAQATFAACLDYATLNLAERVYGRGNRATWATLLLTVCNPWQWFCSTRTLSNCLETTLTATALYFWPWQWSVTRSGRETSLSRSMRDNNDQTPNGEASDVTNLRYALLLAALACILRPTSLLIWICVSLQTLRYVPTLSLWKLIRETLLCGSIVLSIASISDRLFYNTWTFPPLRFLYFNIAQSLAVFYGKNRWDYYLTEGLPLLLTTATPFAAVGIWYALRSSSSTSSSTKGQVATTSIACGSLRILAVTVIIVTFILSLISHKEVRFVYPLLPALHILAAEPLSSFFPALPPRTITKKLLLALFLTINMTLAFYSTQVHQRGVVDVLKYLRHEHESRLSTSADGNTTTSVGFLMPCHSTPWRSHLVHAGIESWALTCEPPLDVPLSKRDTYLDEADQFYANPEMWLRERVTGLGAMKGREEDSRAQQGHAPTYRESTIAIDEKRAWPQYIVFFEQLEDTIKKVLHGTGYSECWRGFNSDWHDDWRRHGDVVVWCLKVT